MKKYEYEYMVTTITIRKADEIAKTLNEMFNQEGYEGWELVQWNIMPPSAFVTSSITPCYGSISVLATFRKKLRV